MKDPKEYKWFPVKNDLIGGWSVATIDKPCSQLDLKKGEIEVADFISEDLARHMADVHNAWLAAQ